MADPLKDLTPELDATGLPWDCRPGKRHRKVFIAGRLVAILPLRPRATEADPRVMKNTRAQIRRFASRALA